MKSKIALFGLSANPPTGDSGHRGIIKALHDSKIFDEIVIIPVFRHMFPEKHAQMQPYEHRYHMCHINFNGISKPGDKCKIYVSDFEKILFLQMADQLKNTDPSYFDEDGNLLKPFQMGTMELVEGLQQKYPKSDYTLHWVLGADTFKDMMVGKWTRAEE